MAPSEMELFETAEGDLWVNEIAPRVHNSGHYSQDACKADQFENHLRAMSGQMLPSPAVQAVFRDAQSPGSSGAAGKVFRRQRRFLPLQGAEMTLHWYNKDEIFPGRKLGHLNCVADTREQLTSRIALMDNYEVRWTQRLQRTQ